MNENISTADERMKGKPQTADHFNTDANLDDADSRNASGIIPEQDADGFGNPDGEVITGGGDILPDENTSADDKGDDLTDKESPESGRETSDPETPPERKRERFMKPTDGATPLATSTPDGRVRLDERALEGFIPIADVERDYISREEAAKAEEAAFQRGRQSRIESEWSSEAASEAPSEIAEIFRFRPSVWG